MKRVLVTGLSGVGKTTLLDELAARGFATVETDDGDFHEMVDGERLWRRDRIEELLRTAPAGGGSVLFVQGTVRNQGEFYPWFDHVVLLSAPVGVMAGRLATRTTNPYGKDAAERAEAIGYVETVEPLLRASATLEIVTTVPVSAVADAVLAHVR